MDKAAVATTILDAIVQMVREGIQRAQFAMPCRDVTVTFTVTIDRVELQPGDRERAH